MATHLVTGGAGFLGSQTAYALHTRGETVRILDLLQPPKSPPDVEFIRGSILDRATVLEAMHGVDVVHHNAALVPITKSGSGFWRVNVDGTQIALDTARKAGVKFFIYISTSAVFGIPASCPITDATPLEPVEEYGRSKLEGERRVQHSITQGLRCSIVRPRTIVGPGRLGIFKVLYEWISEGRRIYVIGDGNHAYQFVHAHDLLEFILLLTEQRKVGAYNIGAERFGTLRQDLTDLIRHAGTRARVVGTPTQPVVSVLRLLDILRLSPLAPWHYLTYHLPFYFDVSRPMRELGWKPRYSNAETFAQSYDWYLAHGKEDDENETRSIHRRAVKQGFLWLLKHIS
jgi:nucleoside-diphosphate-sugar epimerase